MQNTFAWSTDTFVLIQQWKTSNLVGLITAMLVACVTGGLYEWLRHSLSAWDNRSHNVSKRLRFHRLGLRLFRSCLHSLSAAVSYIIMLFLMTYNLWVVLSILAGGGVGFFLLGPWLRRNKRLPKKTECTHSQSRVANRKVDGNTYFEELAESSNLMPTPAEDSQPLPESGDETASFTEQECGDIIVVRTEESQNDPTTQTTELRESFV